MMGIYIGYIGQGKYNLSICLNSLKTFWQTYLAFQDKIWNLLNNYL